jgi:hypothetical protein
VKIRLENRLKHQLQRRLHHPVGGSWYPETTDFARRLGDCLFPHTGRSEPLSLEIISQPVEKLPGEDDGSWCDPVNTGGAPALVLPVESARVVYEGVTGSR